MRQGGLLWWWRYLMHQPHRLRNGANIDKIAERLAGGYRIGLSVPNARRLLVAAIA